MAFIGLIQGQLYECHSKVESTQLSGDMISIHTFGPERIVIADTVTHTVGDSFSVALHLLFTELFISLTLFIIFEVSGAGGFEGSGGVWASSSSAAV